MTTNQRDFLVKVWWNSFWTTKTTIDFTLFIAFWRFRGRWWMYFNVFSINIEFVGTLMLVRLVPKNLLRFNPMVNLDDNYLIDNAKHCLLISLCRGGSKTAATSNMEFFVIIVNGFQSLTIITKCSILDVAAVLDPLLVCYKCHL